MTRPTQVTELTQELRLATTMTGGVSLAIWMAGVAREINLLAQASQWRRSGKDFPLNSELSDESADSLKLYRKLIDLLDMVVDVDVLSGTSAGGINAALLASSRVTGSDLGELRDLWLDLGALTDLLRDPTDKQTPSLLYGDERMFAELAKQLPNLRPGPFPPASGDALSLQRPSTSRRPSSPERPAGSPTRSARWFRTSTGAVYSPSPRPTSRVRIPSPRWHWPLVAPLPSPSRSSPRSCRSQKEPRRRVQCRRDRRWRRSPTPPARTGSPMAAYSTTGRSTRCSSACSTVPPGDRFVGCSCSSCHRLGQLPT